MKDVYVAGAGQTEFGELEGGVRELGAKAAQAAIDDAPNVGPNDVDVAYIGNVGGPADPQHGIVGQISLREIGIEGISVINLENACSSSACAFNQAYVNVASGQSDVALVLGVEKMRGISTEEATEGLGSSGDVEREAARGLTFASLYGMRARAYEHEYEVDNLRDALTEISIKNHDNATTNPYAQFTHQITREDVMESPVLADPLRLYDMCPTTDGAAAAVITSDESLLDDESRIRVEASIHRTGNYEKKTLARLTGLENVAASAYEDAGIESSDVDLFEVHDAATVGELLRMEGLGIAAPGGAPEAVLSGKTQIYGDAPVNPSGGLKARGHPIGATGTAQIAELVYQLSGQAGDRQVDDAEIGLAQNAGGSLNGVSANNTIHILRTV